MAAQPVVTLEGTLERVVYANEESAWSVVRLTVPGHRDPVTAVGRLLAVQPGEHLRLEGEWVRDPKFGRQFKVLSFASIKPATVEGIERYLGSGLIRGIGPVMARRLVAEFGADTLTIIEEHPERLAQVEGIGPKRRAEIRRAWAEQQDIKELMVFLQSHGVSTNFAVKVYKAYGDEALANVRRDPYRLARDIYGVGFLTADRIASSMGVPPDSPKRIEAGSLHLLQEAADRGHLFLPREVLAEEAARLLGVAPPAVDEAVERLAAGGDVRVEPLPDGADEAIYPRPLWLAESGVAQRLAALLDHLPCPLSVHVERALAWFEEREGIELAREQREAVRRGLETKILVVTGGPGTGKTTLVRGIVEILSRKGQRTLLAAPTGRAAKRLSEATGAEAKTLHRLLEWNPQTLTFERGLERPLAADLVIVDEVSMLDVPLAHQLLKAVANEARLVLVGDVDQLPSVGPGRFLADLIRSGVVPVVRLTEIFRQARESRIVMNAHRVNRGEMPVFDGGAEGDFFFIERGDPEEVLRTLEELVARRIPSSFGFDPIEDVQVLTPMNRGLLGTDRLNGTLRDLLNPVGREVARAGRSFRVGDKVMQVRNNYELEVWNGDIGRVVALDEENRQVAVKFDERNVTYEFSDLDELVLAYACSIHKSQGSEYPSVVVPIHSQHWVMLQRNLLYTALTRAKKLAVLVGEKRALATAVRNQALSQRNTLLAERLRGEVGSPSPRPPR